MKYPNGYEASPSTKKRNLSLIRYADNLFLSLQDLRSTAIYDAKNYHFQDIATIHSAVT
jgi:hypothetical protein